MKYRLLKEAAVRELMNEDWEGRSSEERLGPYLTPEFFRERSKTEDGRKANEYRSNDRQEKYECDKGEASLSTKTLLDVCLGKISAPDVLTKRRGLFSDFEMAENELIRRSRKGDKSAGRALELLAKREGGEKSREPWDEEDDGVWPGTYPPDEPPNDYVEAPGEESLGWDAAEGRYYGP